MGGKPNKTPSLEEASLAVIARLEMEVACVFAKPSTIFVHKMNTTLIKEGLQCLLLFAIQAMLTHW
jgi:hypothetical protein